MRKVVGIMHFDQRALDLKRQALFFDTFDLWYNGDKPPIPNISESQEADLDFLRSKRIIVDNKDYWMDYLAGPVLHLADANKKRLIEANARLGLPPFGEVEEEIIKRDGLTRALSDNSDPTRVFDCVPICERAPSWKVLQDPSNSMAHEVLNVAIRSLPVPDDTCAWEDILDFKAEMHDKKWHFRRFLSELASKKQAEAEIEDDIEWTVNEYRKAMELHKLKSSSGFVDVFLVSPLEILEDVVKFRWSKLAKGMLSVDQRRIQLTEDEMNAPGRECAYVFEARKRFGEK